jgi:hypothetical protein
MSTTSSVAGPGKSWLGLGYSPSGLANGGAGMGGPPEALKRILANANRQGSLSLGRNGGPGVRNSRLRGLDSDMDVDSELDEEDGEDDVRMDESSDDGGATSDEEGASGYQNGNSHKRRGARGPAGLESVASSSGPSRRRTNGETSLNGGGGGNLTRAGRPKRSFFDSARPILNGHHTNGDSTRGSRNASYQPSLSTQAGAASSSFVQNQVQQHGLDGSSTSHPVNSALTTTMEQDATAALQGSESLDQRQRELERGRRGEGGGSEVTSLVVSETDVPPGGAGGGEGVASTGEGAGAGAGGATAVEQGNGGGGVSGMTTATTTTTTTAPGFSWMGEGAS